MDRYSALRGTAGRMATLCAALTLALLILSGLNARAEVLAIRTIGVTVSSLDRTERFYRDALEFRTAGRKHMRDPSLNALFGLPDEGMDVLTMQLGDQQVEFTQFERPGRPYPKDSRSPDLWFQHFAIVVSDMDAAYARVRGAGAEPISLDGPETLPERNGHVRAFKFRDPDGHPLELLWFPPGQGRPVWHRRTGLFLGIDHSAIAIASTDTSLAFYKGVLGLSVTYGVTNEGETQERLDGVAGAVVRITGLQPSMPEAPGIEFLDYRRPATGRRAGCSCGRYRARASDADCPRLAPSPCKPRPAVAVPNLRRRGARSLFSLHTRSRRPRLGFGRACTGSIAVGMWPRANGGSPIS